ncbi:hypothetical protein GCM10007938_24390 [Vibrio zhanjiangensis]|uniref:Type III secretion protein n=1 Tax=Vibrio zhanjiangensis TaxID=1046128 RepID=A0ABQ6EZL2_9VIBR|nr:type III secretion system domain-containing protein [Vibrio zhanjiangensis]GLT18658.1 hypothetical protein GCM10007938_24390 [Vibrio zhanjiangensis]
MSSDVIQINRTLRNVSSRLHFQWWEKLELDAWKELATRNDLVSQRLNNAILSRINCENVWLTEDIEVIKKWLSVVKKLSVLLPSSGLIVQGCPDYIWTNEYREIILHRFTQSQVEQLIALWPHGTEPPMWTPENMIKNAEYYSASALYHYWSKHPFWAMLSLSLPIMETPIELSQVEVETTIGWMFRLERFL